MTNSKKDAEKKIDQRIATYLDLKDKNKRFNLPEISSANRSFLVELEITEGEEAKYKILDSVKLVGYVFLNVNTNGLRVREKCLDRTIWVNVGFIDFHNASLVGAKFIECNLSASNFRKTNLTDAAFISCVFNNPLFADAIFENVRLESVYFDENFLPSRDDLDQVALGWRSRLFDWSKLRLLSQIPMFGISWATLIFSLAALNLIGWLNINSDIIPIFTDRVPMPSAIIEVLIASVFLAVASTIYNVKCPKRIKEISEIEWVEKQKSPRLQYFEKRFSRKFGDRLSILVVYLFLTIGLTITGYILVQRALLARCYVISYSTPEQCHK